MPRLISVISLCKDNDLIDVASQVEAIKRHAKNVDVEVTVASIVRNFVDGTMCVDIEKNKQITSLYIERY